MLNSRGKQCIQLLPIAVTMVVLMCVVVSGLKSGLRSTVTAMRLITRRNLNRVMCEQDEVQHSSGDDSILLTLKKDDFRANHINKVV